MLRGGLAKACGAIAGPMLLTEAGFACCVGAAVGLWEEFEVRMELLVLLPCKAASRLLSSP